MTTYSEALKAYLKDRTQAEFAAAVRTSQPAINRYAEGKRFPNAEMAREIDKQSGGAVPFSLWQKEMAARVGITTEQAAA